MNEWMNDEWMNELINDDDEWMNEWMMNEWMNEMNEWYE